MDRLFNPGFRDGGLYGKSYRNAPDADSHDIHHLLSFGGQTFCSKAGKNTGVFDNYGIAGAFWRLFLLYGGTFYDSQKPTGKSCSGQYSDSCAVFPSFASIGKNAGGAKAYPGILGAFGSYHDSGMPVQYSGGVVGLYADWCDGIVRCSVLQKVEIFISHGDMLCSLPGICRIVSDFGVRKR